MKLSRISRFSRRYMSVIFLMLTAVALVSCGSDDGGGGSGGNNTPLPTSFTPANQGFNDSVRTAIYAEDSSGDIYLGGLFTTYNGVESNRIIRLNSDGTVDTAFSVGTGFNGIVTAIVAATDGSGDIYVGGSFSTYNGVANINNIIRLNNDGTVDATFATNVGTGFNVGVTTLALDVSGLYVGGYFTSYNGNTHNRILRLTVDGAVDANFVAGTGFDNYVSTIVPDGVGNIYVGGAFTNYNNSASPINRLVRLTSTGTVDSGFDSITSGGFDANSVLSISLDGAGGIYVAGQFASYNGTASKHIAHIDSAGAIDTTFATNIGSSFFLNPYVVATTLDGTGVYVGGPYGTFNGTSARGLVRLNSDGTKDTTFNTGVGFKGYIFSYGVSAILLANDGTGNVFVGGTFVAYNGTPTTDFALLSSTGALNKSYSMNSGFDGYVNTLALSPDGSGDIYVGGLFANYAGTPANNIVRLNNNGTVDANYLTAMGTGFDAYVSVIAPAADGSGDVYVSGLFTTYNGSTANQLVRLNNDGTIDAGFVVQDPAFGIQIRSIVPTADGSVYIGGAFTTYNAVPANHIVRLKNDGTIDPGFVGSGFDGSVQTIALANDGTSDIFVGGGFTTYSGSPVGSNIVRLKSSGGVDATFVTNSGTGVNDPVLAIAPATDGSGDIYIGGRLVSGYNGTTGLGRILRLNGNGSLDTGFTAAVYSSVSVISVTNDASGDIYAGFSFPGGEIARLTNTGTASATFNSGVGLNDRVKSILLSGDANDNLYVGGWFSSYDHTTAYGIVSVLADGSVF